MTVPFMRAYTELLVRTCHRRGAHAIGGMAAFIPNRRDAGGHRAGARRGARGQGARVGRRLRRHLGGPSRPRAGRDARSSTACSATGRTRRTGCAPRSRSRRRDLLDARGPGRSRHRGRRARQHRGRARRTSTSWLGGNGAAAINNLMEDAATAEISRSQLWQWRVHAVPTRRRPADDRASATDAPRRGAGSAARRPRRAVARRGGSARRARAHDDFVEFLTLPAYPGLVRRSDGAQAG